MGRIPFSLAGKTVSPRGDRMVKPKGKRPPMKDERRERPVPEEIYPVIDNDLARDNLENDLTAADLQDL